LGRTGSSCHRREVRRRFGRGWPHEESHSARVTIGARRATATVEVVEERHREMWPWGSACIVVGVEPAACSCSSITDGIGAKERPLVLELREGRGCRRPWEDLAKSRWEDDVDGKEKKETNRYSHNQWQVGNFYPQSS
jgi:hypothetical protein